MTFERTPEMCEIVNHVDTGQMSGPGNGKSTHKLLTGPGLSKKQRSWSWLEQGEVGKSSSRTRSLGFFSRSDGKPLAAFDWKGMAYSALENKDIPKMWDTKGSSRQIINTYLKKVSLKHLRWLDWTTGWICSSTHGWKNVRVHCVTDIIFSLVFNNVVYFQLIQRRRETSKISVSG